MKIKSISKTSVIKNIIEAFKLVQICNSKFLGVHLFVTIFFNTLPFIISWYTALFINKVTQGEFTSIADPALIFIVSMYVLLPIIQDITKVYKFERWNAFYLQFNSWFNIRLTSARSRLDIQTHENAEFNDLVTKVLENQQKLIITVDWIFDMIGYSVQLLIAIYIVATYKWWIGIMLFFALIPDAYVEFKYGKRTWGIWNAKASIKRKYREIMRHFDKVSSIVEMKVGQNSRYLLSYLDSLSNSFLREQLANIHLKTKLKISATFLLAIALATVFIFVIHDVVTGALAIGTFIFIVSSVGRLQNNLSNFMHGVSSINADSLFVSDILKLLDTPNILKNGTVMLTPGTPGIEFEQVSFAYPQADTVPTQSTSTLEVVDTTDKKVFKNITFTIKPGEKIAMVGVNGAGKTTLTKLLMRFYDPTEGNILIGGHNLKDIDIDTYYKKIGYLSQEYDRFKFSVQEAIGMGNTTYPFVKDKVIDAAKKAQAHEFIMEWPHGYDTQLGKEFDGGVEPSIGQWQKLALARLFYRNPDIWVLDEPTASIDAVAEMEIFHELEQLPKDKTVILISHRFNTVKNADRIMVIEHGEIKEFASHEELMQIPHGIYRTLFTKQKDSFSDN